MLLIRKLLLSFTINSSLVRQISKHNMKIVAGDFNTDRYKEYYLYEKTDRNGEFLLGLMSK